MSEKILVPVLGESITEATVSKWLKNKGDIVTADESIVELETDKVNLDVPAPSSGILSEINSKDGDTVLVGAVLGIISESDAKEKEINSNQNIKPQKVSNVIDLEVEKKIDPINDKEPLILNDEELLVLTDEVVETQKTIADKVLSPAVRKIVSEQKIDF